MRSTAASARATASSRRRSGGEHGAGAVGRRGAAGRTRGRARGRRASATTPLRPCGTSTDSSSPGRRDEEARHGPADARPKRVRDSAAASGRPRAAREREPVQVDAGHELDELGVVAAAEPGGDLDHLRPAAADPQAACRTGRPRSRAPRPRGAPPRSRPRRAATARRARAGRRTRRRRAATRSVTASGTKLAAGREAADGDLRPVDELLDEHGPAARERARRVDRGREAPASPARAAAGPRRAVGRLDDARRRERRASRPRGDDLPARLRARPPSASASRWRSLLVARHRGRRRDGVRQPELLGDPRRDRRPARSVPGAITPVERRAPPRAARSPARRRSRRCSGGRRARSPGAPGSRSQTAVQMPCARAASSRPSCAGPAPSTRRRRLCSRGSSRHRTHCRGGRRDGTWLLRRRARAQGSRSRRTPSRGAGCA